MDKNDIKKTRLLMEQLEMYADKVAGAGSEKKTDISISVSGNAIKAAVKGNTDGLFFALGYIIYSYAKKTGFSPTAVSYIGNVLAEKLIDAEREGGMKTTDMSEDSKGQGTSPSAPQPEDEEGIDSTLWS